MLAKQKQKQMSDQKHKKKLKFSLKTSHNTKAQQQTAYNLLIFLIKNKRKERKKFSVASFLESKLFALVLLVLILYCEKNCSIEAEKASQYIFYYTTAGDFEYFHPPLSIYSIYNNNYIPL